MNREILKRLPITLVIVSALTVPPIAVKRVFAALNSAVAQVTDMSGAARTSYSSSERVTLSMTVQNSAVAAGAIMFSFEIKDPSGARKLYQTGNSAPGSIVGRTGASLRGIPIVRFYNLPGLYTLTTTAVLGTETVTASAQFTILSPVITLTYPPNGARDLIDQPLTFRWVSSGATRYKIYVDDDSSFYNALLVADVYANFFAYPQNPPDQRQRLAGGQAYYWKIDGLDAAGNVIAKTDIPFSFSVKPQSAQSTSKDLAILSVERVNDAIPGAQGALPVAIFVKNQGGRPESNVAVNVFADGAAVPTSPKRISQIDSGKTERLVFPVRMPDVGKAVLVNAYLDFFDDNLQNNTMSRQFQAEDRRSRARLRPSEIWDIVRLQIKDPVLLAELEGYAAVDASGEGMNDTEMSELVIALRDGRGRLISSRLKD